MSEQSSPPGDPTVPTILLRFAIQGVGLGAIGALLVGLLAGPFLLTLAGYIAVAGAVIGGPAGLLAGVGTALVSRATLRVVPLGLAGAAGAALAMVPAIILVGGFQRGPALIGWSALAFAVVGSAVLSPVTLRSLRRHPSPVSDRLGSWLLVVAIVLEAVATAVLFVLMTRTFSVSEACRGLGGGDARESVFPPQITCGSGSNLVELISRTWYVLIVALAFAAVALTAIGVARLARRGRFDSPAVIAALSSGGYILLVGIVMAAGIAQPPQAQAQSRPPAPPASTFDPDAGEEEKAPLDPSAGLPDAPPLSTAFTQVELVAAMQQLADGSFATAGPIDDPEIPAGIQTYPVQLEDCEGTGVRAVLDIWFATGANAAGLDRIETYWASLGYTTLSEPGHVAAAGREPLPAQRLDLLQTWDEDDLRLRLTSVCVPINS